MRRTTKITLSAVCTPNRRKKERKNHSDHSSIPIYSKEMDGKQQSAAAILVACLVLCASISSGDSAVAAGGGRLRAVDHRGDAVRHARVGTRAAGAQHLSPAAARCPT